MAPIAPQEAALAALAALLPMPQRATTGGYRRVTNEIDALLERCCLNHTIITLPASPGRYIARSPETEALLYRESYRRTPAGRLADDHGALAEHLLMIADPLGLLVCAGEALHLALWRLDAVLAAVPAGAADLIRITWERLRAAVADDDGSADAARAPLVYLVEPYWPRIARGERLPGLAQLLAHVADHCAYQVIDPATAASLTADVCAARAWLDTWTALDERDGPLLRQTAATARAYVLDDSRVPDDLLQQLREVPAGCPPQALLREVQEGLQSHRDQWRSILPAKQQALARLYYGRQRAPRRSPGEAGNADGATPDWPAALSRHDPLHADDDPRPTRTGPVRLLAVPADAGVPLPLADPAALELGSAPEPEPGAATAPGSRGSDDLLAAAEVCLEQHTALPGPLLPLVIHLLTEGYATPEAAPLTVLTRWTAALSSLLTGLSGDQLAALRLGCEPHDGHPVYDPRTGILYLPLEADLRQIWPAPDRADVPFVPVVPALSVRLPPLVRALWTRCHNRARARSAAAMPSAALPSDILFVVDDACPRPLHAADLAAMWPVLGQRLGRRLSGGHLVNAWEALALVGGLAPGALPLLCGRCRRWGVSATYLAPPLAAVDRWARQATTSVLAEVRARAEALDRVPGGLDTLGAAAGAVGGDAGSGAAVTLARWLPECGDGAEAERPGAAGTRRCHRPETVGNAVRAARLQADVLRLTCALDDDAVRRAVAQVLVLELQAYAGLRVEDLGRCTRSDLQRTILPTGQVRYTLVVLMKSAGGGALRPRLLMLPVVLQPTIAHYLAAWPAVQDAAAPLVPGTTDTSDPPPLAKPGSCRHLIATHVTTHLERYACALDVDTTEVVACLEWWMGHWVTGWSRADSRQALETRAMRLMDRVARDLARLYALDDVLDDAGLDGAGEETDEP